MNRWNVQFTQLVRGSLPGYWGNWSLGRDIAPGAVGSIDPETGSFRLASERLPGMTDAHLVRRNASSDWNMMTSHVTRREAAVDLDGSAVDPETGTKVSAGLQVSWTFGRAGEMVSQCALESSVTLAGADALLQQDLDWLVERAAMSGMGSSRGISQGFGVVTQVLYARSGLNVGSLSEDNTFSLTGTASGVNKLLGEAKGKGSFTSSSSSKSVDKHLWPSEAGALPGEPVPLAFAFASFDGRLLLPSWITHIGAYQLILRNNNGGTYIVKAELSYDTPRGRQKRNTSVSGGLVASFGDIPLDASNIDLALEFVSIGANERKTFHWDSPRGQWLNGIRHIDLFGVWPGATRAVDVEAGIALE